MSNPAAVAKLVVEQAVDCGVELVASLPDNWMASVIREFDLMSAFGIWR